MRLLFLTLCAGSILFGTTQPAKAQFISQSQRFESGRVSIDTATGARCSATGADRASASIVGGTNDYGDSSVAAIISVPIGGPQMGDCDDLLAHEEGRSRLELASQLFEVGALSAEEFKQIADDVAEIIK